MKSCHQKKEDNSSDSASAKAESFSTLLPTKANSLSCVESFFSPERDSSQVELEKAYDYAAGEVERSAVDGLPKNEKYNHQVALFLSVLSDALHVDERELADCFDLTHIKAINDSTSAVCAVDNTLNHNIENYVISVHKAGFIISAKKSGKQDALSQEKGELLQSFIARLLHDYTVSFSILKHPIFRLPYVSCYPKEKHAKAWLRRRFSSSFRLPEKDSPYARPILDIELHKTAGPCVRCYLTLFAKAEDNSNFKDITQDSNGVIQFHHVKLMNFGDPLRALTWVEDYLKNREHENGKSPDPLIRSFLIPLETYVEAIQQTTLVDADRAPGQVRLGYNSGNLNAVSYSLVTFSNSPNSTSKDGRVLSLEVLSNALFGKNVHPKDLAVDSIAHQHDRMLEDGSRYVASFNDDAVEAMVNARKIERYLSGFAFEPTKSRSENAHSLLRKRTASEKYSSDSKSYNNEKKTAKKNLK